MGGEAIQHEFSGTEPRSRSQVANSISKDGVGNNGKRKTGKLRERFFRSEEIGDRSESRPFPPGLGGLCDFLKSALPAALPRPGGYGFALSRAFFAAVYPYVRVRRQLN